MAAFWAPFLLVHLGGPDTITACALEDNELWPRHLLGLFVQSGVALYVFIRSWGGFPLNYIAFPMFVAGLVKYGERTWVLRSASRDNFGDAMLPPPDRGPSYSKFMDDYSSKLAEGYKITMGTVIDVPTIVHWSQSALDDPDAAVLDNAYYFFKTFKWLFADLILSFQDRQQSQSFFTEQPWGKAFGVIEVELGLMYDLLYTKATLRCM
ncbi:hypothetical protein RHGRI_025730 [Rhododendron griersonianum]|uniref:DUF4220 domain-containing protein n=1 Tax=Rhododendron griersonianum TaxID=479676 RepID=A0AAV6IVD1_9ERIC|nr:hypothetical protein RHGRI_025730 [Rhododendron griersonianum]